MNEYISFPEPDRNHTVFIHCPLEPGHREHLCALTLAVIASGHGVKGDFQPHDQYNPRLHVLAQYISESKYSIHDCSFCQMTNTKASQYGRYNLPIELGMALAERHRIQRIYNRDSEKYFHEMFVCVRKNHAYHKILSGLIKLDDISLYNSTDELLQKAFQWLYHKDTSLKNNLRFEQVQQVWEIFKDKYKVKYCQNDGHGVNIEELSNDILNICKETDWWQYPEWMTNKYPYDVFLAHNSKDRETILKIKGRIENDFKLKTWIDIQEIPPGSPVTQQIEHAITRCKTIAIFFSQHDVGNWQFGEIAIAMARCFEKETTVIPVLLPNFGDKNQLPLFIRIFRWVEFSTVEDPLAIKELIWGITGKRS
ncbi:hypothetical protein A6770_34875 [Nostoc minutum NIES-26]|uniref:TIR domain-containing protein n=1 Tax=Nostoc minutum NIES-26 TaxID=1844469 RepID=A0A367S314_9NOSO|nr:hypothetical protein A6770_34875 [Nostoc minutum NIES-26]